MTTETPIREPHRRWFRVLLPPFPPPVAVLT